MIRLQLVVDHDSRRAEQNRVAPRLGQPGLGIGVRGVAQAVAVLGRVGKAQDAAVRLRVVALALAVDENRIVAARRAVPAVVVFVAKGDVVSGIGEQALAADHEIERVLAGVHVPVAAERTGAEGEEYVVLGRR